jgi:centromere protein C
MYFCFKRFHQLISTALVISPAMIDFKEVPNHGFKFKKTYSEGQFIASGFLLLPPGSEKPNKNSKDASMVFIVLEGICEVMIHQSRFTVSAGTQFCVPRGTYYTLFNKITR